MLQGSKNTLTTYDVNATRMAAVRGTAEEAARVLPLDESRDDLPLALSLQNRHVEVGQAGLALCRTLPHLACLDFLGYLATERHWNAGRHRLDAAKALGHVFARVQTVSGSAGGVFFVLPSYLAPEQTALVYRLAEKNRWHVLGSMPTPLAAALAAHSEQAWVGPALVIHVDDYALTISIVQSEGGQGRLVASQGYPRLGYRLWKERLLDAIALRCVRQSRRDPRDSAPAEQALYEQLRGVLDACQNHRLAEVIVKTSNWCQNLLLRPEELAEMCQPLITASVEEAETLAAATAELGPPGLIVLTAEAGLLPGLAVALEQRFPPLGPRPLEEEPPPVAEDFGESLLEKDLNSSDSLIEVDTFDWSGLQILPEDSPLRAGHDLAVRVHQGQGSRGPIIMAPMPGPMPVDAGPVRIKFQRQEYFLTRHPFTMGRHPQCQLIFDSSRFPTVSAYHCEVVEEKTGYIVRDHSRNGTLVNNRPIVGDLLLRAGDWIRLGPGGPAVRFLGKSVDQRRRWSIISG